MWWIKVSIHWLTTNNIEWHFTWMILWKMDREINWHTNITSRCICSWFYFKVLFTFCPFWLHQLSLNLFTFLWVFDWIFPSNRNLFVSEEIFPHASRCCEVEPLCGEGNYYNKYLFDCITHRSIFIYGLSLFCLLLLETKDSTIHFHVIDLFLQLFIYSEYELNERESVVFEKTASFLLLRE